MTIDDVAKIGERLLGEYQDRLKPQTVRKFDPVLTKQQDQKAMYYLPTASPEQVEAIIRSVLEGMVLLGDFIMSEPRYETFPCAEARHAKVGNLRLTFVYGASIVDLCSYLWVACWYYPPVKKEMNL